MYQNPQTHRAPAGESSLRIGSATESKTRAPTRPPTREEVLEQKASLKDKIRYADLEDALNLITEHHEFLSDPRDPDFIKFVDQKIRDGLIIGGIGGTTRLAAIDAIGARGDREKTLKDLEHQDVNINLMFPEQHLKLSQALRSLDIFDSALVKKLINQLAQAESGYTQDPSEVLAELAAYGPTVKDLAAEKISECLKTLITVDSEEPSETYGAAMTALASVDPERECLADDLYEAFTKLSRLDAAQDVSDSDKAGLEALALLGEKLVPVIKASLTRHINPGLEPHAPLDVDLVILRKVPGISEQLADELVGLWLKLPSDQDIFPKGSVLHAQLGPKIIEPLFRKAISQPESPHRKEASILVSSVLPELGQLDLVERKEVVGLLRETLSNNSETSSVRTHLLTGIGDSAPEHLLETLPEVISLFGAESRSTRLAARRACRNLKEAAPFAGNSEPWEIVYQALSKQIELSASAPQGERKNPLSWLCSKVLPAPEADLQGKYSKAVTEWLNKHGLIDLRSWRRLHSSLRMLEGWKVDELPEAALEVFDKASESPNGATKRLAREIRRAASFAQAKKEQAKIPKVKKQYLEVGEA